MSDIWIKKSNTNPKWAKATAIHIKRFSGATTKWFAAKVIWIKNTSQGWLRVWPTSGVFNVTSPFITTTASGSTPLYSDSNVIRIGTTYYGRIGTWDPNGFSISSYNYLWPYYSTGVQADSFDELGNLGSGVFVSPSNALNISSTTNANASDGKFISFRVTANASNALYSNTADSKDEYGKIKIVRRTPQNISASITGNTTVGSTLSFGSSWDVSEPYKPDAARSTIYWYRSDSPTNVFSGQGRTQVSFGSYSYVVQSADLNKYIVAEETVFNTGSDYDIGTDLFTNGLNQITRVTSIITPGLTGATSTSIVSMSRLNNTTVRAVIGSSGASGPYYQLYWQTGTTPTVTSGYDAAGTTSTVTEDHSFAAGTYYFFIRSSSENLGNTTTFGTATEGTYSAYGPSTGAASYTFASPTGGTASISGSTTVGSLITLSLGSPNASPIADGLTIIWRIANGGTGGNSFTGGTILQNGGTTLTIPSTAAGISTVGYSIRAEVTWNNGVGSQLVNSNSFIVTAAATKLSTPTNVAASDTRTDGIQVSWTNVSNAATYGVWWGGAPSYDSIPDFGGPNNNGGVSITSSPFLDTGAPVGSRTYYVQAFPSSGSTSFLKSDWSTGDSGTRLEALSKLSTPTGVNASDTRTDGVNVTWNAVANAAYYGVWYGPAPSYDSNPDFGGPSNPTLITGTSYLDTSIGSGVTRDYYVQAFRSGNPAGTKSDWGGPNSGTRAVAGTAPSGGGVTLTPSGTQQAGTTISANVTAMSGTATISYTTTIRKKTGSSPTSSTDGTQVASGTGTGNGVASHTITAGEASGTPDQFRAFTTGSNSFGSNTVASNTVTSTPATVSAPGIPTSVSLGGSGVVAWTASTGSPTSYEIEFFTAQNASGLNAAGPYSVTGISGTSYQLTSPYASPNNWARVRVRARNSGGASSYSAWVPSATTFT